MKRLKQIYHILLGVIVLGSALFLIACGEAPVETSAQQVEVPLITENKQEMEVHFLDVGQADCTLIISEGHAMLIDAGDDSKGTAIQNYLQKQGVQKLDYLVLTHPDADHIGAAPVVITKFDIDTVFMSNYEKDNKTYMKLIQALDDKNLKYSTPSVGDEYVLGDAYFTIIAPNDIYDTPNNSSVGLLLCNGENKFLFTGDAEEEAEKDIVSNKINIDADVYQAGHHGSKTASSRELLDAVTPDYVVISCAQGNSYGHPHAQTLNNLRSMGAEVFRTDEQGTIVALSDGTKITWNCAPSETWQVGESTQSAQNTQLTEVHITKTGEKYHSAGCQYLSKSDIVVTLDEAKKRGLDPCGKCSPPQ